MATQIIPQDILDSLPKQFGQKTITQQNPNPTRGSGLTREVDVIDPPANAIAITAPVFAMGKPREQPTGEYYIPLDIPDYPKTDAGGYPVPPLVAKYDASGKLQTITALQRYIGDAQNNISIQPEYNLSGELISTAPLNNAEGEGGGFGDFLGSALKDFGPMIALGLGANYLAGSGLLSGGAGAAGGAAAKGTGVAGGLMGSTLPAGAGAGGFFAPGITAGAATLGIPTMTGAPAGVAPGIPSGAGGAGMSSAPSVGGARQDIPQLRDQLSRTPMPEITSGRPIAGEAVPGSLPDGSGIAPEGGLLSDAAAANDALAKANITGGLTTDAVTKGAAAAAAAVSSLPDLSSLGEVGSAILDFAKANPSLAGSLIGAVTSAIGAKDAPTSTTTTSNIDPQIKAEYLANLERAKTTAAGLEARKFADFSTDYGLAEEQVKNLGLGGKGQKTTDEAARLAAIEAGFTPQQIAAANAGDASLATSQGYTAQQIAAAQANRANVQDVSGQLGSQFMGNYFNPFEEQVVQGALGDIERTRQMQEQANRASAISARAFGGTRQGVVSGMTNEAALRQSGSTAAGLRQAGFNQAVQFGQTDAARQFQAQMANQGVSLTLEQANAQLQQQAALSNQGAFNQAAQFGSAASNQAALVNAASRNQMAQANAQLQQQANLANQQAGIAGAGVRQNAITQMGQLGAQQQNLGLSGANAVMLTQLQRQQLEQQRLDALRNLGSERLQLTSGALGMNIPNLGMSSTTPLYNSTAGNFLSGALTGGYIGSLLDPNRPRKPGDFIPGP